MHIFPACCGRRQIDSRLLEVSQFAQGGIGFYDGRVPHVDVREHPVSGQYVGIGAWVREPEFMAKEPEESGSAIG